MIKKASNAGDVSIETICKILDDHKALDINVIDLTNKSSFADFMIIASGTSQRHLSALSEHLEKGAPHRMKLHIEGGKGNSDWVLVDLGHVVVHLFRPEIRQMYDLESMWSVPMLVNAK